MKRAFGPCAFPTQLLWVLFWAPACMVQSTGCAELQAVPVGGQRAQGPILRAAAVLSSVLSSCSDGAQGCTVLSTVGCGNQSADTALLIASGRSTVLLEKFFHQQVH